MGTLTQTAPLRDALAGSQSTFLTAWASILAFHCAGPLWCTELPRASTATVK
jgi:hypothetical protein